MDSFLSDLRTSSGEKPIHLTLTRPQALTDNTITVTCVENTLDLEFKEKEKLTLHYSKKAEGFDAQDWFEFQKKFLLSTADLAPAPMQVTNDIPLALSHQDPPQIQNERGGPWHWVAAVALGGLSAFAAYKIYDATFKPKGVQVEIQ